MELFKDKMMLTLFDGYFSWWVDGGVTDRVGNDGVEEGMDNDVVEDEV